MTRNYSIYPSMIGSNSKSAVIWSYSDYSVVTIFDNSVPLKVSADQCGNSSICVWYISPLEKLKGSLGYQFALLGELNKWTAVSRQRFTSITIDRQKNEGRVTVEGVFGERIPVSFFHSIQGPMIVYCPIPASGQTHVVITEYDIVCS